MKVTIECTWDEVLNPEAPEAPVNIGTIYQKAGFVEIDADRCSGGGSCSLTCPDGATHTLYGFSQLCICSTSAHTLRLDCGPAECPSVEIRCQQQ